MVPMRRGIVSLDHIHCYRDDEVGSAEPYLLTAFFKIDGDGNYINFDGSEQAAFIDGFCTFRGTTGTHGNLGDTTVSDGDDVPIPPALGEFQFALEPITAAGLGAPERKSTDIRARLQRTRIVHNPPFPDSVVITTDYELFGSIVVAIPLQVTGVTADGGMWHALRDSNGSWVGFGDVKSQAGAHAGAFTAVACAGIGDELHVCGVTTDGRIWHAIREPRRWIGFGDVKSQTPGNDPGAFAAVACVGIGDELRVCGVTTDGGMWHIIRHATSWEGFGDVKIPAGHHPGIFTSVACAEVDGELHVCGSLPTAACGTPPGAPTGHGSDSATSRAKPEPTPGAFTTVACAEIGGELHVCGVTTDGRIWRSIRHALSWDGFGDVKSQGGTYPGVFTTVACAAFDQDLHVCGTTTDGGMWHTIRHATSWDGFGDVKIPTGHHPGAFIGVGCGHA